MSDGSEYDDFFEGSGGGAPSFKFSGAIGDVVSGEVLDQFKTQQTKFGDPNTKLFFDDGAPRMQLNVTLQTALRNWDRVTKVPLDENDQPKPASEDDGKRRIYIKSDMQRAVGKAIREATGKGGGLRNGGTLAVKLTGFKDVGKGNPLPLYEARYKAPEPGAEDGSFFAAGSTPPAQQPASPQTTAPPADPWGTSSGPGGSTDEPPF
jgi:hypothetical protein